MNTEELEQLQRRWRQSGDLGAGAGWLAERERLGLLSLPRLELAAYLGDEAGRRVIESSGRSIPSLAQFRRDERFNPNPHKLDLREEDLLTNGLVRSLGAWGWEPLVRAAIACAELQVGLDEAAGPGAERRVAALGAAIAFVLAPSSTTVLEAQAATSWFQELYEPFACEKGDEDEGERMWVAGGAPWFAAESAAQDWRLTEWDTGEVPSESPTWCNRLAVWPTRAAEVAASVSSNQATRDAIKAALVPWALGLDDPLGAGAPNRADPSAPGFPHS